MPIAYMLVSSGACAQIRFDFDEKDYVAELINIWRRPFRETPIRDESENIIADFRKPTSCRLQFCDDDGILLGRYESEAEAKEETTKSIHRINDSLGITLATLVRSTIPKLGDTPVTEAKLPAMQFRHEGGCKNIGFVFAEIRKKLEGMPELSISISLSSRIYQESSIDGKTLNACIAADLDCIRESLDGPVKRQEFN